MTGCFSELVGFSPSFTFVLILLDQFISFEELDPFAEIAVFYYFDHDLNQQVWHYAFHDDTLPIEKVKRIGVASNDIYGNTDLVKFEFV